MISSEIESRINFLREEIAKNDRLYYVDARPVIGDADYDALYRELQKLERDHPEFDSPDSPTKRVGGAPFSKFLQVRHNPPMRSLDKTHSKSDLSEFDAFLRRELSGAASWNYIVEPKIDGVSISLLYKDHILSRAATRGNGEVGDDVTANVRTIRSVPLRLPPDAPSVIEVRGEIYMTREGFVQLNAREEEAGREPFMNPRNAAAGSLKQLDPREAAKRPLDIIIYNSGGIGCDGYSNHSEMISNFHRWGFPTPPWSKLCPTIDDAFKAIDELETLRHTFRFEIDGAVLKVNDRSLYSGLGSTAKAPRWARAYKYAPERVETVVEGITVQVGRTGVLTPVAELHPVELAGSLIARATLHNSDEITRRDIRIGDHVWLVKAGDVIPAIESSIPERRDGSEVIFQMPTVCPECGAPVIRLEGEVASRCTNPACPAQRLRRIEHFASRGALDIRTIGDRVAKALLDKGLVTDPLDLFTVSEHDLASLDIGDDATGTRRFGKNAATVQTALDAARKLPLSRWLFATGIPNVGTTVAADIAAAHTHFSNLPDSPILRAVVAIADLSDEATKVNPRSNANCKKDQAERTALQAQFDELCGKIAAAGNVLVTAGVAREIGHEIPPLFVSDIKPESARATLAFFTSDYGKRYVARLAELGIDPVSAPKQAIAAEGPLVGAGCVLTGSLSRPRDEFAERIRLAGGIVQNTVSKNTKYLIAGENVGETKTAKARSLGTIVIGEAELEKMLAASESETAVTAEETKAEPQPEKSTPTPKQDLLF